MGTAIFFHKKGLSEKCLIIAVDEVEVQIEV
jgi:hypothetical protein